VTWESYRTDESRQVEEQLRPHFQQVDAYRYNAASIRVRILDPRFKRQSVFARTRRVEPVIAKLPDELARDIIQMYLFTPEEALDTVGAAYMRNLDFTHPDFAGDDADLDGSLIEALSAYVEALYKTRPLLSSTKHISAIGRVQASVYRLQNECKKRGIRLP
jgi:hypothetical protein